MHEIAVPISQSPTAADEVGIGQNASCAVGGFTQHLDPEEVGHYMLPYIRDQILELVNESLLVAVL